MLCPNGYQIPGVSFGCNPPGVLQTQTDELIVLLVTQQNEAPASQVEARASKESVACDSSGENVQV